MPSLQDLPPELLHIIINYVIHDRRLPPLQPSETDRLKYADMVPIEWYLLASIYHERLPSSGLSNGRSLLLTNHHLAVLTTNALHRPLKYALDIYARNELDLFPTWLSVPVLANRIETLEIDLRFFGNSDSMPLDRARKLMESQGIMSGFFCIFYRLLERILCYGPVGEKSRDEDSILDADPITYPKTKFKDRDIAVRTLIIDVTPAEEKSQPSPQNAKCLGAKEHSKWDVNREIHLHDGPGEFATRAEWLANDFARYFQWLISTGFCMDVYGTIIYERIGRIQILADGEAFKEFNLSQELADMPAEYPDHIFQDMDRFQAPAAFQDWKNYAIERRELSGISCEYQQRELTP